MLELTLPPARRTERAPRCTAHAAAKPRRAVRGFTLIELMVTLSIGVLLMVVAVPSFVQFRRNADLSDASSSFIMAANAAKSASLKSSRNTIMQWNVQAQGWRSGWLVFLDNGDNVFNAADDQIVTRRDEPLAADITITPTAATTLAAGYLSFSGSGFPRTTSGARIGTNPATTLDMAITGRTTRITLGPDGRLRSCKVGDTGC